MHVFCICTCSAQLNMFHTERRSRNTLIISSSSTNFNSLVILNPVQKGGGGWGEGGRFDLGFATLELDTFFQASKVGLVYRIFFNNNNNQCISRAPFHEKHA